MFKIKKGLNWEPIPQRLLFAILTESFGFVSPSLVLLYQGEIILTQDGLIKFDFGRGFDL